MIRRNMQAFRTSISFWVALLTFQFPIVSAFEGDEFNNNLFSDLGPILALFGEQVTKQFMAGSTTWEENILLTMAPLGIMTAVIAAIRIGGPLWLKAIIGRARENKATAEVELTTSTSEDVCEMWNGSTIVRIMGSPTILELLYFPFEWDKPSSGLYTSTNEEESKKIFETQKVDRTLGSWINHKIFGKHLETPDVNNSQDVEKGKEEEVDQVTTSKPSPKKPSQNAPSVFLNLKPPKTDLQKWELRLLALFAISLQIAVVVFWACGSYNVFELLRFNTKVDHYAFPISVGGTVLLIGGLTICAYIVDACTIETFSSLKEKYAGKALVLWLQQGGNINDQNFDSFAIFAKGERKGIWTSRLSTSFHFGSQGKTESNNSDIDKPQQNRRRRTNPLLLLKLLNSVFGTRNNGKNTTAPNGNAEIVASNSIKTLVIIGTIMSATGFVAQFTGIRAMHWSASIAQLIATGVMVVVRAWVRRDLVTQPKTNKIPKGHELDWMAIRLGAMGEKLWVENNGEDGSGATSRNSKVNETRRNSGASARSDISDTNHPNNNHCQWTLARSVRTNHPRLDSKTPTDSAMQDSGVSTAQQVMKIRERLGRLSTWTGRATKPAIAVSNAIEIVLNSLLPDSELQSLGWKLPIQTSRGRTQTQINPQTKVRDSVSCSQIFVDDHPEIITLSITRSTSDKRWAVKASEIEAVLSLWLYSVEGRLGEAEASLKSETEDCLRQGEDWIRQGDTASRKPTMRILGPKTERYEQDMKWYLGSRMDRVIQVTEQDGPRCTPDPHPLSMCKPRQFLVQKGSGSPDCKFENFRVSEYSYQTLEGCEQTQEPTRASMERFGIKSDAPLETFYAQDLFASFMWAISKYIEPLGGETKASSESPNSSWKDIRVENDILSRMMKGIEKEYDDQALGSLEDICHIVLAPLSLFNRLPAPPEYLLPYALDLTTHKEKEYNNWSEATDIYIWLLDECDKYHHSPSHNQDGMVRSYGAAMRFSLYLRDLIKYDQRPTRDKQVITYCLEKLKEQRGSRIFDHKTSVLSMALPYMQPKAVRHLLQFLYMLQLMPKTLRKIKNPQKKDRHRQIHNAVADINKLEPVNNLCLTQLHRIILKLSLSPHDNQELLNLMRNTSAECIDSTRLDCTGWTPLHYAVRIGHTDAVEYISSRKKQPRPIHTIDTIGKTPLHYARNPEVAEILIQEGADPNTKSRDGTSPLHCAVIEAAKAKMVSRKKASGDADDGISPVVNLLLEAGAEINITDNAKRTPLHWAASLGAREAVQLLVEKGANVMARENRGKTPLHLATTNDNLTREIFQDLESNFDFEAVDEDGSTPLYHALHQNHLKSAEILIGYRAGIETPNVKENRQRPLHLAIQKRLTHQVRLLVINAKADVNAMTSKGVTPLHMALEQNLKDIVEIIVEHGANLDVNIPNRNGETALDLTIRMGSDYEGITTTLIKNFDTNLASILNPACSNGDEQVLRKYIIDLGANIRQSRCEKTGSTPLHRALEVPKAKSSIVELLLNEGKANVNAKDYSGVTPIHLASKWGNEDIIRKLLVDDKMDINASDNSGWTALHWVCRWGSKSCAQLLVDHRANVEARTVLEKFTPLHVASKHGRDEIVVILITKSNANIEATTKTGDTSLHLASAAKRIHCVNVLLKHGGKAKINSLNNKRQTPLDVAMSRKENDQISNILRQNGAKQAQELKRQ